jgi:hypothetical protein
VVFNGLSAKETAQVRSWAASSGYSSSIGTSQTSRTDGAKGGPSGVGASASVALADPTDALGIGQNNKLPQSCNGFAPNSGCKPGIDQKINLSHQNNKSYSTQLDPNFENPFIAEHTSYNSDGVMEIRLPYRTDGLISDATIQAAAQDYSDGSIFKKQSLSVALYPAGPAEGNAILIKGATSPFFANKIKACTCESGSRIGGYTDVVNLVITMNVDSLKSTLRQSFRHELGHLFFGVGHPSQPTHFLYGGVMDYGSKVVNSTDRAQIKKQYAN